MLVAEMIHCYISFLGFDFRIVEKNDLFLVHRSPRSYLLLVMYVLLSSSFSFGITSCYSLKQAIWNIVL